MGPVRHGIVCTFALPTLAPSTHAVCVITSAATVVGVGIAIGVCGVCGGREGLWGW